MIPQPITANIPQDAIVQKVTIGFLSVWNAAEKVHSERTHRERDVNQRVARRNKDNDTGYDIEIYRVREWLRGSVVRLPLLRRTRRSEDDRDKETIELRPAHGSANIQLCFFPLFPWLFSLFAQTTDTLFYS